MAKKSPPEVAPESFIADTKLRTASGKPVDRYGTAKQACAILGGCRRQDLYDLIDAGIVKAFKLRPDKANSHFRVDLMSVWNHRQKQLQ